MRPDTLTLTAHGGRRPEVKKCVDGDFTFHSLFDSLNFVFPYFALFVKRNADRYEIMLLQKLSILN